MDKISILNSQSLSTLYSNYSNQNAASVNSSKTLATEDSYIKTSETLVPDVYTDKPTVQVQEKASLINEDDYEFYCVRLIKGNGEKVYFPPKGASDEEKLAWINTCKQLQSESDEAFSTFSSGLAFIWEMENGDFSRRCAQSSVPEILEDYLQRSQDNLMRSQGDLPKDVYDRYIASTKRNIDALQDLLGELKTIKTK